MTARFWHGFADMHVIKDTEVVIASGDGAVITDTNGKDYIDATAALWFCNAGYGRREIADAVAEQLAILPGYSSFGAYTTDATLRAAERLTALSPIPNSVVFLGSGGSDAIDTATKLARRYWDVVGKPNKTLLVSREHSYHGMHAMGTSLGGIPALRNGYGGEPFINEVVHVPALDVDAVARVFDQRRDEVAAFVGEPVIGAGGVIPPTETYWREISELCRRYDVLLIADEVITGFGRMGTWWATLERILATAVRRLEGAPLVGEIRTVGLTAAVAIAPAVLEKEPATPDKVVAAALRHGVASRVLRAHAIHISPPFVITEDQIDRMVDGIARRASSSISIKDNSEGLGRLLLIHYGDGTGGDFGARVPGLGKGGPLTCGRMSRGHPRPHLPGALDPGGGPLHRRLPRAVAPGRGHRRGGHRLLRRALHGRDRQDPLPRPDRPHPRHRGRMFPGRQHHRGTAQGLEGGAPRRSRRRLRQHLRRGEGGVRLLLHLRQCRPGRAGDPRGQGDPLPARHVPRGPRGAPDGTQAGGVDGGVPRARRHRARRPGGPPRRVPRCRADDPPGVRLRLPRGVDGLDRGAPGRPYPRPVDVGHVAAGCGHRRPKGHRRHRDRSHPPPPRRPAGAGIHRRPRGPAPPLHEDDHARHTAPPPPAQHPPGDG